MFIDCSHYQCPFYDGISIFLTSRSGCGSTLLLAFGIIPVKNMDHISWFLQLCALHGINFDCALFTDQGPLLSAAQKLSKTSRPLKLSLMFCLQHLIRNVCHRFSNIQTDFPLKECHEGMAHSETMESFFKSFGCFIEKVFKSGLHIKTVVDIAFYVLRIHPCHWTIFGNSPWFRYSSYLHRVRIILGQIISANVLSDKLES